MLTAHSKQHAGTLLYAHTPLYKAMCQAVLWVIVGYGFLMTHNNPHAPAIMHRAKTWVIVGSVGGHFKSLPVESITF